MPPPAVPVTAAGMVSQSICLGLNTFPLNSFFHLCVFYCALPKVSHNFGNLAETSMWCFVSSHSYFFLSLLRMINSSCYFFFFEISFSFSSLNTKLDRNDNSLISETVFLLKTELQDIDPFVSHWKKNQHLRTQSLRAVFYTTFQ